ncbi:TetR/AcrR family transcriptional regulator [Nocardiopsis nanhaiensis]
MPTDGSSPSPRRNHLLEAAYRYALDHGLADLSLRPLSAAIGTSPRVLLYLFGSKDGLVRELLGRARADELALLERLPRGTDLPETAARVWGWLTAEERQPLLTLWVEGYARSLVAPQGPWADFAAATVRDWLEVLARSQPDPDTPEALAQRTRALALLRGALLDLLATGDTDRVTRAVQADLADLADQSGRAGRSGRADQ